MESDGFVERAGRWPAATKNYIQELHMEMRRVTWPNWKQVRATTLVVIIAVFGFAAYFYVVDNIIARAVQGIFHTFAGVAAGR